MQFTQLNTIFADQAANLDIAKFEQIAATHSAINAAAFSVDELAVDLSNWAENGASVVAHNDGELKGFIVGKFIDFYHSKKAFFSPDWAHAVADSTPSRLLAVMYAWISRSGQIDQSQVHAISVYAADTATKTAFTNLEFGVHMMEGVLALPESHEIVELPAGYKIRPVVPDDIPAIAKLDEQLWTHLSKPPTYLELREYGYPTDNPKYVIPRDDSYISVAEFKGQLIGFISSRLGVQEFKPMRASNIPAINGAFVDEDHRDSDIAQAMLNDIFRWASQISAPYVTVDFESTNIEGSGFWRSRNFTPLAYGLTRRIP